MSSPIIFQISAIAQPLYNSLSPTLYPLASDRGTNPSPHSAKRRNNRLFFARVPAGFPRPSRESLNPLTQDLKGHDEPGLRRASRGLHPVRHGFQADVPPTHARHGLKTRFHTLRVRDAVQHVLQLAAHVLFDGGRRVRVRVIEHDPRAV